MLHMHITHRVYTNKKQLLRVFPYLHAHPDIRIEIQDYKKLMKMIFSHVNKTELTTATKNTAKNMARYFRGLA